MYSRAGNMCEVFGRLSLQLYRICRTCWSRELLCCGLRVSTVCSPTHSAELLWGGSLKGGFGKWRRCFSDSSVFRNAVTPLLVWISPSARAFDALQLAETQRKIEGESGVWGAVCTALRGLRLVDTLWNVLMTHVMHFLAHNQDCHSVSTHFIW